MRYGITIAYYGGCPWPLANLTRELARDGIPILEIRGCAYPEMARAEQVRQALASEIDVVVFIDAWVTCTRDEIDYLVGLVEASWGIASACTQTHALSFCAVHREALERIIESEKRRYANSAVDLLFRRDGESLAQKVPACPIASPWLGEAVSVMRDRYPTDSEAFIARALLSGVHVHEFGHRSQPEPQTRVRNSDSAITGEPGSKFAICIPSFGPLDLDQMSSVYALEKAGMAVIELNGCAWIDQARSWLAEMALQSGRGVFFLDHDILFDPNDVLRLCEQALDMNGVVAGCYCMRASGRNYIGSLDVPPGTSVKFFDSGETLPAFYSGLGFAAIPRGVLESIELPRLHSSVVGSVRPWFALDCSTGFYAGEDVSFCNRVHDLKVTAISEDQWQMVHSGRKPRVWIDTRVRIFHVGKYCYGLEDAGCVVPRYQTLESLMCTSKQEARYFVLDAAKDIPVDTRIDALTWEKPE